MNLLFMLLSSMETAQITSSELVRDSYLFKIFGGLFLGVDAYILNLIPGVNAECTLISPRTECSSVDLSTSVSQLGYTTGSPLDIPLEIIVDCTNLNEMLEQFSQDPVNCSPSNMLLMESISHMPHKSGLLRAKGIQNDHLDMEFLPSRSLSEDFQLSIKLMTVEYCYTLTGEECQGSCVQGCKSIQNNREIASNEHEVKLDLFAMEPSPKFSKNTIAVLFFSVLGIFVMLIATLFILKNKCKSLRLFWSSEDKRRYLAAGDVTAEKSKLEGIN